MSEIKTLLSKGTVPPETLEKVLISFKRLQRRIQARQGEIQGFDRENVRIVADCAFVV